MPVDRNYPKDKELIEDNAAKIDGANQLMELYFATSKRKYLDISTKLMIALYHNGVNFDEFYDGLVSGVCYDVVNPKNTNCSFIKADLDLLNNRIKIKKATNLI